MNDSLPKEHLCPKCIRRDVPLNWKTNKICSDCLFSQKFFPNFKLDVTLTTSKLDYFTIERYPQYAKNDSKTEPQKT